MAAANICKEMHWDYWTYCNQPAWFIDLLNMRRSVDAEFAEVQLKRSQSTHGNN